MVTFKILFRLKLYFMSIYRHSGDTYHIVDHLYNYTHWLLDHPHSVKTIFSCIIFVSINIKLHKIYVKKILPLLGGLVRRAQLCGQGFPETHDIVRTQPPPSLAQGYNLFLIPYHHTTILDT